MEENGRGGGGRVEEGWGQKGRGVGPEWKRGVTRR